MRIYWIERDDGIDPHMAKLAKEPAVRVFTNAPPFAFGEVAAFFVGQERETNATRFVEEETRLAQAQARIDELAGLLREANEDVESLTARLAYYEERLSSLTL